MLSVLQAMKRLATTWGRLTTWEGERLTTLGEGEGEGRLTTLGGGGGGGGEGGGETNNLGGGGETNNLGGGEGGGRD